MTRPGSSEIPQALMTIPGVSRETLERLHAYVRELQIWQRQINLVSPTTLDDIWTRHILDSAQLQQIVPEARIWADLGSGAGLPGVVISILLADRVGTTVHLVESNGKKAAFLRHVTGMLRLPTQVHAGRIETVLPRLAEAEIVTARALTSLDALLAYSSSLLKTGAIGLFPKGRDVDRELTEAAKCWQFKATLFPSVTDSKAKIVRIDALTPRKQAP